MKNRAKEIMLSAREESGERDADIFFTAMFFFGLLFWTGVAWLIIHFFPLWGWVGLVIITLYILFFILVVALCQGAK